MTIHSAQTLKGIVDFVREYFSADYKHNRNLILFWELSDEEKKKILNGVDVKELDDWENKVSVYSVTDEVVDDSNRELFRKMEELDVIFLDDDDYYHLYPRWNYVVIRKVDE